MKSKRLPDNKIDRIYEIYSCRRAMFFNLTISILTLLPSCIFLLYGNFSVEEPFSRAWTDACAYLMLAILTLLTYLWINPPKRFFISESGITDLQQNSGLIPWSEIQSCLPFKTTDFSGVCLELANSNFLSQKAKRRTKAHRAWARVENNRNLENFRPDVFLNCAGLGISSTELQSFIEKQIPIGRKTTNFDNYNVLSPQHSRKNALFFIMFIALGFFMGLGIEFLGR